MSRYDIPDPKCQHRKSTGFVGWPSILDPGFPGDGPMASTYVCDRTECIEDAIEWTRAKTGRRGVHVTFAERDAAREVSA